MALIEKEDVLIVSVTSKEETQKRPCLDQEELVTAIEVSLRKVMNARDKKRERKMSEMSKGDAEEKDKKPQTYLAPDGGWGWAVVFGAALANMTSQSLVSTFGLLFGDALTSMGQETTGAALVLNVMSAITNLSGLITGPVIRRFSYRKVAITGGILFSGGILLASAATSMLHLIFTFSILSGLGLGLSGPASFVAISTYFSKRRGRAVGLALVGTGVGQMLMPQFVRLLLDYYGFQGAMLLIGGASLHAIFGASLYQPVTRHLRPLLPPPDIVCKKSAEDSALLGPDVLKEAPITSVSITSVDTLDVLEDIEREDSPDFLKPPLSPDLRSLRRLSNSEVRINRDLDVLAELQVEEIDEDDEEIIVVPTIITQKIEIEGIQVVKSSNGEERVKKRRRKIRSVLGSCWGGFIDAMDLPLFLDPVFVNIVVGIAIFHVSNINFSMVFPFFIQNLGYTRADAALCMTVTAAADISSRLVVPWITDRVKFMGSRNTLLVSMVTLAFTRSLLAQQTGLQELVATSVACGFVRGGCILNLNLSIAEYCSNDKLAAALGINMVLKFFAILSLGPFLGWLRDATGSYPVCIHAQSLLLLLTGLAWTLELIILWYRRRQQNGQNISEPKNNDAF